MSFKLSACTSLKTDLVQSKPVQNAMSIFRRDMQSTLEPGDLEPNTVIINVNENHDLDPEQFRIICTCPTKLIIKAKDELGAIYGLLYLSRHYLGIEPFWFWQQQKLIKRNYISIPQIDYLAPIPRVRFRGWFINDEVLLSEWPLAGNNAGVWPLVLETLLRCQGNMVIPGTDYNSKKYRQLAADMGLWVTHHHAEPLGAEMFARAYPDKTASYVEHKDLFLRLWTAAIREQKDARVIWNIGFRGQGDKAFWADDPRFTSPQQRGALISQVIKDQCELVRQHIHEPIFCTNLYGEILALYQGGHLDIPTDVIKIWGDSGYGKMVSRQQGNSNPRHQALAALDDQGLNGIYYHASFYDLQASNHITMTPNSPEMLNAELDLCLARSMDQYWIINCGNVKPHSYILDLIREKWVDGEIDIHSQLIDFLTAYFPKEYAAAMADLYLQYSHCTIQYGIHIDEKAGEQFYHHPARNLVTAALQHNVGSGLASLCWATGDVSFAEQVTWFRDKCLEAVANWERLLAKSRQLYLKLPEDYRRQFYDGFVIQVEIHHSGCLGFIFMCEALLHMLDHKYMPAFIAANRSFKYYSQGVSSLETAEHDPWQGFYANDCLTNIRLTVYCCESLCRYIRVIGDGPSFHSWERKYLYSVQDQKVILLTNTKNHLSDEELFARLEHQKLN